MAISFGSDDEKDDPGVFIEINTTPLIDVMLVLLIMLIITIPVQTHSVALEMPDGQTPISAERPDVVTVDIDYDGAILWNLTKISGQGDLEARLKAAAASPSQPELHLRPNKLAPYRTVAAVMAAAQRQGIVRLGIVGNEQFLE
jgi:biopolymer transport protein ExbD